MIARPICLCILALLACHAHSQAGASAAYPRRTVTIVVPYSPGAATDILARACAQRFTEAMGQQFIVVNRDGATGAIGTELVAKAQPDGYTLLWGSSSPLAINPIFSGKLAYDSVRDFAPIGLFASISYILVVHPSVPAKSLRELIALAKARPGSLNYASSGAGGAPYLSAELMKTMVKVDVVHVPYKGTTLFMTDLISGQIELAFTGIATSMGYLNNGASDACGRRTFAGFPGRPHETLWARAQRDKAAAVATDRRETIDSMIALATSIDRSPSSPAASTPGLPLISCSNASIWRRYVGVGLKRSSVVPEFVLTRNTYSSLKRNADVTSMPSLPSISRLLSE